MTETELRLQSAISEQKLAVDALAQRCMTLAGDNAVLRAKLAAAIAPKKKVEKPKAQDAPAP